MKNAFALCLCLIFSGPAFGQSEAPQNTVLRSTIHYDPNTKEIDIDGNISLGTLEAFKKLDDQVHFKTLVINSSGGDINAGIDLAGIIKSEHITLIIDGACMSACANYLFAAADKIKVLPGSAVVVHGSVATGLVHFESAPEEERRHLNEAAVKEREFYNSIGMHYGVLALYDEFISRLEQDHMIDVVKNGTGGESCPPIRGWAPLEDELKAWGIKGITEFWYPKTEEDFALVEKKTGLPTKYIFFGSSNSFSALCRSRSAFENSPSALKPNN